MKNGKIDLRDRTNYIVVHCAEQTINEYWC